MPNPPPYYTILELFERIDEPDRAGLKKLYLENRERLITAPGSTHNHQAWPGGWHDHTEDLMNYDVLFYPVEASTGRPMPFTESSSLKTAFLHDIEKPWKKEQELVTDAEKMKFRIELCGQYGIPLSPDEIRALEYIEGEKDDYSKRHRISNPLAAWVGNLDRWSARGRPDFPGRGDPWSRHRDPGT